MMDKLLIKFGQLTKKTYLKRGFVKRGIRVGSLKSKYLIIDVLAYASLDSQDA